MKLERQFQRDLIRELKQKFKGCIVTKLDTSYAQGLPDILILHEDKWAALECKQSKNSRHRPNQDKYIEKMNKMSYASFIFPENKEEVLNELQRTFESGRKTRTSRRIKVPVDK